MPRLTAADELFVHQIPEPLPNVVTDHDHWRESYFFILHPREQAGDVVILTMAHYPKRRGDGLAAAGADRRQLGLRAVRPAVRGRPAHDEGWAGDDRYRRAVQGSAAARGRRGRGAGGPDVHGADGGARPAPGDDEARVGDHLGPEPHDPVGELQRDVHAQRRDAHGRQLVGPARPLVGHPRPRAMSAVDVAGDPAPGRDARGVALGVRERRARVHGRLLRAGGRQRADPGGGLPARAPLDGQGRQAGGLREGRRGDGRARGARRVHARGRAGGSASMRRARGARRTGRSAAGCTRCRCARTTGVRGRRSTR